MDTPIKVYKSYVFDNQCDYYLWEGTLTDVEVDGVQMVRHGSSLSPLTEGWHFTKAGAKGDAAKRMAVLIGISQARLDKLRDEILHETLTTEEVPHGVA
jgi:hypothetical protein